MADGLSLMAGNLMKELPRFGIGHLSDPPLRTP
jgi:hypothetical protein